MKRTQQQGNIPTFTLTSGQGYAWGRGGLQVASIATQEKEVIMSRVLKTTRSLTSLFRLKPPSSPRPFPALIRIQECHTYDLTLPARGCCSWHVPSSNDRPHRHHVANQYADTGTGSGLSPACRCRCAARSPLNFPPPVYGISVCSVSTFDWPCWVAFVSVTSVIGSYPSLIWRWTAINLSPDCRCAKAVANICTARMVRCSRLTVWRPLLHKHSQSNKQFNIRRDVRQRRRRYGGRRRGRL